MKQLTIIIALFLLTGSAAAGGFKTENEIKIFSNKFMDHVVDSNFVAAFNSTKPAWPLPEVEIDGIVNQIAQQWPMIENRFGKSLDREWLKEERIGKSFLRYYYLHKFEKHAVYWYLDFYKSRDTWLINKILFRDDLDILFE